MKAGRCHFEAPNLDSWQLPDSRLLFERPRVGRMWVLLAHAELDEGKLSERGRQIKVRSVGADEQRKAAKASQVGTR